MAAEGIGHLSLPFVVVPHPVGDRDQALIRRRGEAVAAECVRVLTTPVETLQREFRDKQFPPPAALMPR